MSPQPSARKRDARAPTPTPSPSPSSRPLLRLLLLGCAAQRFALGQGALTRESYEDTNCLTGKRTHAPLREGACAAGDFGTGSSAVQSFKASFRPFPRPAVPRCQSETPCNSKHFAFQKPNLCP